MKKIDPSLYFIVPAVLIMATVFSLITVSVVTSDNCMEKGYSGGVVMYNFHRYCTKRYRSIYESSLVPYDKATPLPERTPAP